MQRQYNLKIKRLKNETKQSIIQQSQVQCVIRLFSLQSCVPIAGPNRRTGPMDDRSQSPYLFGGLRFRCGLPLSSKFIIISFYPFITFINNLHLFLLIRPSVRVRQLIAPQSPSPPHCSYQDQLRDISLSCSLSQDNSASSSRDSSSGLLVGSKLTLFG